MSLTLLNESEVVKDQDSGGPILLRFLRPAAVGGALDEAAPPLGTRTLDCEEDPPFAILPTSQIKLFPAPQYAEYT